MNDKKQKSNNLHTKRIMVFDFHSKMMIEVIKELQNRSIDILYWTASKKDFMQIFNDKNLFPDTIFHDTNDAAAGIPAWGIDATSFRPVDRNVIEPLLKNELQALLMMENIDRTSMPAMKKRHLYNTYVKYWHGVLATLKPDALIFSDVPHMAFRFTAYCLAKHLGIRCLMLRNTRIAGRMFIVDDHEDFKKLRNQIKINLGKNFTLNNMALDIKDYYEKQTRLDKSPWFFRTNYVDTKAYGLYRFLPSMQAIKKNVRGFTLLKTLYLYIRMLLMKRNMPSLEKFSRPVWAIKIQERRFNAIKREFKREYLQYAIKPDFSKKYVYVTLHCQPERSTSVDGDIFVDQILMIDMLSYVIPHDWIIYVKENPMQWVMPRAHVGRFRGYTKEIVKHKNVYVVSTETGTFDLMRSAQAVATVTGTAAWEAVLRGKPALMFGYTWSMYCDGIFQIQDLESCKKAIEKITAGYIPDQQKIINYLKAFDETTILGYQDRRFRDLDDANITYVKTDEQNIKSVADAFYKELVI